MGLTSVGQLIKTHCNPCLNIIQRILFFLGEGGVIIKIYKILFDDFKEMTTCIRIVGFIRRFYSDILICLFD